ncbi:hypothetical protein V6N13_068289 [Hibiscus sabdariffa]
MRNQNDAFLMKLTFQMIAKRNALRDVQTNVCWSIGYGCDVDFWFDPWVSAIGPLINHVVTPDEILAVGTCVDDMAMKDGE